MYIHASANHLHRDGSGVFIPLPPTFEVQLHVALLIQRVVLVSRVLLVPLFGTIAVKPHMAPSFMQVWNAYSRTCPDRFVTYVAGAIRGRYESSVGQCFAAGVGRGGT